MIIPVREIQFWPICPSLCFSSADLNVEGTLVDHDCWTIIELNVGVASASMPVMRPLLRKVFKVRSGIDMNMIRCDLVTVKSIQQLENQTSWSTHGGTE